MRLRSHLILLVLVATLPLAIFASVVVRQNLDEQRRILDRGMQDTARALALAVDGEVKASLAVLQTLASSPLLDTPPDFATFHRLCERAVEGREAAQVILFDRSGNQVLNSGRPYGSPLPNPLQAAKPPGADPRYPDVPLGGDAPVRTVIETSRPFISDLFISLTTGVPRIGVDVPVIRDGRVQYVLELSLDAAEFTRFLLGQRPESDVVLAVLDRKGIAIARTVNPDSRVGQRLAPDLARQVDSSRKGIGVNAEGISVYHAFVQSRLTGWTTSVSMRESTAFASLTEAFGFLALGAAIAILLALAAAILVGRRISRPIASLAGSAQVIARGEATGVDVFHVSELRELHSALVTAGSAVRRAAEDRERAILNHVLDGIITIDERGRIESFNRAAERIFGYAADEVLGQDVQMLMPENYRPAHAAGLANYLRTGEAKVIGFDREVEGRRKDGTVFPMDIAVSEVRVGDRRWFTGIARDITARKQVENAMRDANRAKDEFLAVLSHELRNPLAALSSASYVLNTVSASSPEAADARGVVHRQTKHITRLVSDLLDISRISLGKLVLQRERFDFGEMVASLAAVWRASGRFDRHNVCVAASTIWVDGDRARLEQITSNLVDNAIKFTPAGGGIAITVRAENGTAVLEVRDEGIGIPNGERDRIFEMFTQGQGDRRTGLGIGLALVKKICALHDGLVHVESNGPNRGTVFQVRLQQAAPTDFKVEKPTTSEVTRKSVLVVEDNDDARRMLHAMLASIGHQVRAARDGRSALALATEALPALAFIDIDLPDIDGYEVARQLRGVAQVRRIGLIAITGYGQEQDQQRALEAGFDAHLVKPVSAERLHQVIAELS